MNITGADNFSGPSRNGPEYVMVDSRPAGEDTKQLQALHSFKVLDVQPEARFERVTSMARRLFGVPIAVLKLDDRIPGRRDHAAAIDFFEAARTNDDAARTATLVIPDAAADPKCRAAPSVLGGAAPRFYAGCPVQSSDGIRIGTLALIDTQPRQLSREEQGLLGELSSMVSEIFSSLSIATSDELTKLANRRGFEAIAGHILPMAIRLDIPLSLVQFDLDGLKQINDTYGHEAGDRMLVSFARQLLKNFRESDVVARLGGDEFCVLLSGAGNADVTAPLERLEDCLCEAHRPPIRFSAGVATLDAQRHVYVGDLLREADHIMYESKRFKQRAAQALA